VLVYTQFLVGCSDRHEQPIAALTVELIRDHESPQVVHLGSGLRSKLGELGSSEPSDFLCDVRRGDGPVGDGSASHHVILTRKSDGEQVLGLRIKYDPDLKLYHIKGFWTP